MQSGIAARQASFPAAVREPCCNLRYIGGDGTGIGVQIKNLDSVQPVWKPPVSMYARPKNWGALDRCVIGNNVPLPPERTAKDRKDARQFMKLATETPLGNSQNDVDLERLAEFQDLIPPSVYALLVQWIDLNSHEKKWSAMRSLLRASACQDSLCGVIPESMLGDLRSAVALASRPRVLLENKAEYALWCKTLHSIRQVGMGPQIAETLTLALDCHNKGTDPQVLLTVCAFLTFLGELCTKQHSFSSF